ncbi:MAG: hypothetical protein WAO19_01160 [Candidatus Kryptoniota bacterium]
MIGRKMRISSFGTAIKLKAACREEGGETLSNPSFLPGTKDNYRSVSEVIDSKHSVFHEQY